MTDEQVDLTLHTESYLCCESDGREQSRGTDVGHPRHQPGLRVGEVLSEPAGEDRVTFKLYQEISIGIKYSFPTSSMHVSDLAET